jgi:hypothetical protein
MFQVGFDRQIFSDRHPQMGISFNDIEGWWKTTYPTIKQELKPAATQPLPGTVPIAPTTTTRLPAPVPSSGPSTALVLGGLAVAGLGAYFLFGKQLGLRKK